MSAMGTINSKGQWAPLKNMILVARAVERTLARKPNLPGFLPHYGPSGCGKTHTGTYIANRYDGVYVPCRSYLTRKTLLEAILKEMGARPARTIAEMMEQVSGELDLSRRPLILDECDNLIERNALEIVRDLHDMSHGTFLLIGEEQFPRKLKRRSERFHNRVLVWLPAQLASREDAQQLAAFYCPGVTIAEDLLESIRKGSAGIARVICVNLDAVREHCEKDGIKKIDLDTWGKRLLYTGDAPARDTDIAARRTA